MAKLPVGADEITFAEFNVHAAAAHKIQVARQSNVHEKTIERIINAENRDTGRVEAWDPRMKEAVQNTLSKQRTELLRSIAVS